MYHHPPISVIIWHFATVKIPRLSFLPLPHFLHSSATCLVLLYMHKMEDILRIHLETDQLVMYGTAESSAGCVLRGVVSLDLNQTTRVRGITLRFTGKVTKRHSFRKYKSFMNMHHASLLCFFSWYI